jgi:hypothetical protein
LTGVPDEMQESHEAPRLNQDDQLRQQPVLDAASATRLKISSLFMALLSKGYEDSKLYITVDETQLRVSRKFDNAWHSRLTPIIVW